MLHALRQPDQPEPEAGFTLIELMVVVLIIGILLAIAIPTFLGARARANDRSAQSNLRNALTAERTVFVDTQRFSADVATGGTLAQAEANLLWVTALPNTGDRINQVSVLSADQSTNLIIGAASKSGKCFYILDISAPATNSGTYYAQDSPSAGACPAAPALPGTVSQAHADQPAGSWSLAY